MSNRTTNVLLVIVASLLLANLLRPVVVPQRVAAQTYKVHRVVPFTPGSNGAQVLEKELNDSGMKVEALGMPQRPGDNAIAVLTR